MPGIHQVAAQYGAACATAVQLTAASYETWKQHKRSRRLAAWRLSRCSTCWPGWLHAFRTVHLDQQLTSLRQWNGFCSPCLQLLYSFWPCCVAKFSTAIAVLAAKILVGAQNVSEPASAYSLLGSWKGALTAAFDAESTSLKIVGTTIAAARFGSSNSALKINMDVVIHPTTRTRAARY